MSDPYAVVEVVDLAALAVVVSGLLLLGAPAVLQVLWLTAIVVVAGARRAATVRRGTATA